MPLSETEPVIIYRLGNEGMVSGKGGSDFSLCCHTQSAYETHLASNQFL
jgi:hypothetical protein